MQFKRNSLISTSIIYIFFINLVNGCPEEPFKLDEHFVACCLGRPKFTSESCIDELLTNDTFSQVCLLDCMYRKYEFYDESEIDLAAVQSFFSEQIGDESFISMYMNAFKICNQMDRADLMEKFSFVELENIYDCDMFPQIIDICIWYHTLANCPEHYAANDEGCKSRQDWVNNCLF